MSKIKAMNRREAADAVWEIAKRYEVADPDLARGLKRWSGELHEEAARLERSG